MEQNWNKPTCVMAKRAYFKGYNHFAFSKDARYENPFEQDEPQYNYFMIGWEVRRDREIASVRRSIAL